MIARILRAYAVLFAVAGIAFVAAPGLVVFLLDIAAPILPGARPLADSGPTLWLALTGSMMAMITYLSLEAARDTGQEAAWNALLLSKGMSTALFVVFAAASRNSLFFLAAATDGAIFAHLRLLRRQASPDPCSDFAARFPAEGPAYEVWFAKFNDPKTRNALWLRYTKLRKRDESEASCWYVLFDKEAGRILTGRWKRPVQECQPADGEIFELAGSALKPGRMTGEDDSVSWDFAWTRSACPPFGFVPTALALTGLASSEYTTPVSLAEFDGSLRVEGRAYVFKKAPGCVGHVWGRRMAETWRWAHAVFPGQHGRPDAVLEILWAQVRVGGLALPGMTCANLWLDGRLHRSFGLWRGLRNASRREADRWSFRLNFGEFAAEGECAPAPALTAELDYESPDGRKLLCRNSKTGSMSLRLSGLRGIAPRDFTTPDGAAVEFAASLP